MSVVSDARLVRRLQAPQICWYKLQPSEEKYYALQSDATLARQLSTKVVSVVLVFLSSAFAGPGCEALFPRGRQNSYLHCLNKSYENMMIWP